MTKLSFLTPAWQALSHGQKATQAYQPGGMPTFTRGMTLPTTRCCHEKRLDPAMILCPISI